MVIDMNFDKKDEVSKILNEYRQYIKENFPLFYKNRNYFYKITKKLYELSPKLEYFDRKSLKNNLTIIEENKIRKYVNNYFKKTYNLDVSNFRYLKLSSERNTSSKSYYKDGVKTIELLINNNIQDCFVMAHEFRHYLNMTQKDGLVQNYLTEALSIFEELNLYYYIKKQNIVSDTELNIVNKMTFIRHSIISEKNLVFFKLERIINDNGEFIANKRIYSNADDIQKDIYYLLDEYNHTGLQYHNTILYSLGILIASSIMRNIKNNKINLKDFEKLNDRISNTSDFNILHLVKVDINDIDYMIESYKKELEDIF